MGFFDSFKQGFEKENETLAKTREYSKYRTVKQREDDNFEKLDRQSDSSLLNKMNKNIFTSDEDKKIIDEILRGRGYSKSANGSYRRL